ncbi:cation transporter [Blastopirellula sp. JC732]|uniref:Cation transporter n=1 Tax=Blastopirellula sediminis TaxID=2894196 RepID=A0A9X1MN89_9BACT|nr:cation transporter [Blastopirellula sediminis]MCC9609758.1 cation transporter [Blastopirellula sediminis]MCC9629002.1 cation transporter [Blastopirellula sediminis]
MLRTTLALLFSVALFSQAAYAETTVTLTKMHLCCGKCVKAVEAAVKDMPGVKVDVTAKEGKTVLTAADDKSAQAALDAIAKAGFHAETDSEELKMKDDSGVKAGAVKRLALTGLHNCCGACTKSIKEAVATVDGVKADTAKPNESSMVIEGNFDAAEVVEALLAAGFHVKVKQ